ncbi:MAG: triphosphoribosyl-dephospho-CoA synthase [Hyphomicrobiales bacterium]|nr:triphosphoribosyl-dephospho-CoA synthase [Hyphomicrobiales bacterium]
MLNPETIEAAFHRACIAELEAIKPGNVHIHAAGHGMDVADFVESARAAAPHMANQALGVGERIWAAMRATWDAVGKNTNLGILLLCAPLAAAAGQTGGTLRERLASVLENLTVADAEHAFRAIALASPAGLGADPEMDVRSLAKVTLREAMRHSAWRDRIAFNYTTAFEDVFERGLPFMSNTRGRFSDLDEKWVVTELYMYFLRFPDTHIERKHGRWAAIAVQQMAVQHIPAFHYLVGTENAMAALLELDAKLKARGFNPGTSADLTVATMFAANLEKAQRPVA